MYCDCTHEVWRICIKEVQVKGAGSKGGINEDSENGFGSILGVFICQWR